jgi:hypothetical protein
MVVEENVRLDVSQTSAGQQQNRRDRERSL